MKLSLIISLLFLASCSQVYAYNVRSTPCEAGYNIVSVYRWTVWPTYKDNAVKFYNDQWEKTLEFRNVCDFSYTKTPIK